MKCGDHYGCSGSAAGTRKGYPNRTVEFKRELATAACAPGVSVAKLALEHRLNTNLLFKWRREYRAGTFGPLEAKHVPEPPRQELAVAASRSESAITLLPVQTAAAVVDPMPTPARIEVVFRSATVRISGEPAIASLRAVLDTLVRRS